MKSENQKILEIPFSSQNSEEVDKIWRDRACGITCVKMVLDYLSEKISLQNLITEGLSIDAYDHSILGGSWKHEGLVRILRNHGALSYSQEYRTIKVISEKEFKDSSHSEKFTEEGIKKIANQIDNNSPSIISVKKGFNKNQSSHLIVITGYEKSDDQITGFFYHDPDSRDGKLNQNSTLEIPKFKEFWRRFVIFTDSSK